MNRSRQHGNAAQKELEEKPLKAWEKNALAVFSDLSSRCPNCCVLVLHRRLTKPSDDRLKP